MTGYRRGSQDLTWWYIRLIYQADIGRWKTRGLSLISLVFSVFSASPRVEILPIGHPIRVAEIPAGASELSDGHARERQFQALRPWS
jgi:hypothetical protein